VTSKFLHSTQTETREGNVGIGTLESNSLLKYTANCKGWLGRESYNLGNGCSSPTG
jgi:hypothetical protein